MAKPGDWGGGGAAVPRMVKRTGFAENRITEPEAEPIPGPAPKLQYYSEPQYAKEPIDPEFKSVLAKGSDKVGHGR